MGDDAKSRVRWSLESSVSEVSDKLVGLTWGWSGGCRSVSVLWWSVACAGEGTLRSLSTAEIREDKSDLLPFLSKRALKLSLLDNL